MLTDRTTTKRILTKRIPTKHTMQFKATKLKRVKTFMRPNVCDKMYTYKRILQLNVYWYCQNVYLQKVLRQIYTEKACTATQHQCNKAYTNKWPNVYVKKIIPTKPIRHEKYIWQYLDVTKLKGTLTWDFLPRFFHSLFYFWDPDSR